MPGECTDSPRSPYRSPDTLNETVITQVAVSQRSRSRASVEGSSYGHSRSDFRTLSFLPITSALARIFYDYFVGRALRDAPGGARLVCRALLGRRHRGGAPRDKGQLT